jgi:hypothetical protein
MMAEASGDKEPANACGGISRRVLVIEARDTADRDAGTFNVVLTMGRRGLRATHSGRIAVRSNRAARRRDVRRTCRGRCPTIE